MISLERAKEEAARCREDVGLSPEGLVDRLIDYLWDEMEIEAIAVSPEKLRGSYAEVRPPVLLYNEKLISRPDELLLVLAHELGHLKLHPRLRRLDQSPDPLFGAVYADRERAVAVARYSPKAREEAEATAFAIEFLCPSAQAFEHWLQDPDATSATVAQAFGATQSVARVQLAEALYRQVSAQDVGERKGVSNVEPDESQRAAILHAKGGPALVDAGPGTGKTATLTKRIQHLCSSGAKPHEFLVLTFSNEAADELRRRLEAELGVAAAAEMAIATFHGFGRQLLHYHGHLVGYAPDAMVLDEAGQKELLWELLGTVDCEPIFDKADPTNTTAEAARHINYLKQRLASAEGSPAPWTPETLAAALESESPPLSATSTSSAFCRLFSAYESAKRARHCYDFADLISLPIRILQEHPEVASIYHEKYRWVLVDEFQDVSSSVGLFLELLCSASNPPWVVGDARQAIYRFQGAAPENVTEFKLAFPAATVYPLKNNYRSCDVVVQSANHLATLLADSEHADSSYTKFWTSRSKASALGEDVVTVATANSDPAEHEGIAARVRQWLDQDIPAHEIAVLARRNVDVRNIVLKLGEQGIRATASGILTPEGAAGDLANVVTLVDGPRASLPRVAYALGRDRYGHEEIDTAVARLLSALLQDKTFAEEDLDDEDPKLAFEVIDIYNRLRTERYSAGAFGMLAAFLFDCGGYLRSILGDALDRSGTTPAFQQVTAHLQLTEIATSLSRAAGFHFTHADLDARQARIRFGQHFRQSLNDATPTAMAPHRMEGAVQVMTCHAAKGLEFPCVVVAGQTLSQADSKYEWLPDSLQPDPKEDLEQADALLFVGLTRAQRTVTVSYAATASGSSRARSRDLPSLLERWVEAYTPPQITWPDVEADKAIAATSPIWGARPRGVKLSTGSLYARWCPIRTYLQDMLRMRYPEGERPIYPLFFETTRFTLEMIVRSVHENGAMITEDEAEHTLRRLWKTVEAEESPHVPRYFEQARSYVQRFVRTYEPLASSFRPIRFNTPQFAGATPLQLRLGIVSAFFDDDNTPTALLFRPESYADALAKDSSGIKWSGMKQNRRLPLVLLRSQHPSLNGFVYSGDDGRTYPFNWSQRNDSMDREAGQAAERMKMLTNGQFQQPVNTWTCDRCSCRTICPHWLKT